MRLPRTGWRASALGLAGAGVVHVLGVGLAPIVTLTDKFDVFAYYPLFAAQGHFTSVSTEALAYAALAAVVDRGNAPGVVGTRRVLLAVLFATVMMPRFGTIADAAVVPVELGVAAWLVVPALRESARALRRNTGASLYGALVALTYFEALLVTEFLRSVAVDIHLHDTYFVVGAFHLEVMAALSAVLALAHRDIPQKGVQREGVLLGLVGGVLILLGSHVFHFAMLGVGAHGMPRRYVNYLPEFQALHVLATTGAILLVSGLAIGLLNALRCSRIPGTAT